MGKVDDMRRRREAQHRQANPDAPSDDVEPAAPAADADTGACSVCGKVKALQRGLVASHQKGLGSMCPGSRKPPA